MRQRLQMGKSAPLPRQCTASQVGTPTHTATLLVAKDDYITMNEADAAAGGGYTINTLNTHGYNDNAPAGKTHTQTTGAQRAAGRYFTQSLTIPLAPGLTQHTSHWQ
jgi:hypothetical protein